jgi:hypothetical protein
MFVDIDSLPKSLSDGPQSWGEAWSTLGGATDTTQALIENTTADAAALDAAYERRIRSIEQLTGQSLANPLRVASGRDRELIGLQSGMGGIGGAVMGDLLPGYREEQEAAFETKARALAERYPQVNTVISTSMEEEKHRLMREAEDLLSRAAASPELGMLGRFSAQLVGGLRGAARDPAQWGMAIFGAGPAAGKTVAGRIGKTMFQEFLLNGGQEAFLQAASQERKRAAGVEHGMANALANVGLAGTFGSLFGGTVQAGAEIARVLKLGEGGAERATRVLEGRPEPGDVEAIAAATGKPLSDDVLSDLGRSFEDRVLDDMMIPENATPDDATLMAAAVRHAEDPDNFPTPEIVERALADSADGPTRTLSADDYQRIYDGDEVAVDAYRDQVASHEAVDIGDTLGLDPGADTRLRPDIVHEPLDDAAVLHAEQLAGEIAEPRKVGQFGPIYRPDEFGGDWQAAVRTLRDNDGGEISGMLSHPEVGPIDIVWGRYDATNPKRSAGLAKIVGKHPEVVEQLPSLLQEMSVFERSENRIRLRSKTHRAVVRLDYDGESKTWLMTAFEDGGRRAGKMTDRPGNRQGDGHSSSPSSAGDSIAPIDDAGNLADIKSDPDRPRGGEPERVADAIPVEDGDGNVRMMSVSEALAIADEPAFHADLLEACKL